MMKEFVSVQEAKEILKGLSFSGGKVQLPLQKALGYWTASPIHAPMAVPTFDNSGMDGYAFAWADGGNSRQLAQVVQAGSFPDYTLQPGTAVRIFTGAPVPKGADTIVQQEGVRVEGNRLFFDREKLTQGMNFRRAGSQCKQGQLILPEGTRITPGTLGLLASLGVEEVSVYAAPQVSIILTGDEVVEVGQALQPGQIYNANGPALVGYLNQLGIPEVKVYQVKDDPHEVNRVIGEVLASSEVLLLTGGISVGDFDFVKEGLAKNGVESLFYKVKQKPGKPLLAGIKGSKLVFALPGNPASVLTCFMQYVKPSLGQWMGNPAAWEQASSYPLATNWEKQVKLTVFLKARLVAGQVEVMPGQESFNLLSFGSADGLIEIREEQQFVKEGTLVSFYPW
ncbi:MAG: molybdopterin molybdotransferase MoeA [Bacteroidetes bacterium]|nr:molybdopterin molybdotransferase MoeA [Bacteroidota bacterium]